MVDPTPKTLTPRFTDALTYAVTLHARQRRKVSGEPYVAHLLAVTAIVLEYGGDEDQAIAALLHDAIEDQGGTATGAEVRRRFGPRVAETVEGCSDAFDPPKPPWQQRKDQFLARLAEASPSMRLVIAADKLHNVRSLTRDYRRVGDDLWAHFRGGREGTLWYYRSVAEALAAVGREPIVEELLSAVAEFARLAAAPRGGVPPHA